MTSNYGRREFVPVPIWMLLKAFITEIQKEYQSECVSLYLLGSAVTGHFHERTSDIDVIVIFRDTASLPPQSWLDALGKDLQRRFPVVSKIDTKVYKLTEFQNALEREDDRIVCKTEGVLAWGKEVLSDYKLPDSSTKIVQFLAQEKFRVIQEAYHTLSERDDLVSTSRRLAKQTIRLVYYVVVVRNQLRYTPVFSELREAARSHSQDDFKSYLNWAEGVITSPPTKFEELRAIYDTVVESLPIFKAEILSA